MPTTNSHTKWAEGAPLNRLWVEIADTLDEIGALISTCRNFMTGRASGRFVEELDRQIAEMRPKSGFVRAQRREKLREPAQEIATYMLATGIVGAHGILVSPEPTRHPSKLMPALFAAALDRPNSINWDTGVVTIEQVIVGQIRVVPTDQNTEIRKPNHVQLMMDAIREAMRSEPGIIDMQAKEVGRRIEPILNESTRFAPIRSREIATVRRAINALKDERVSRI